MTCKRRESGVALILVLVVVAVATAVGMCYVSRSTVKMTSSDNLAKASRAGYLAESGLHHGLYLLQTHPDVLTQSPTPIGPFFPDGPNDSYVVSAAAVVGQPSRYVVTAGGTTGGITQSARMDVQLQSAYDKFVSSLNPTHYWRMGEVTGATASDLTGGLDGTYNGVSLGMPGPMANDPDKCPRFDGQDDFVNLHDLNISGNALSIVAWIYPDAHNHLGHRDARIFSKARGTGTGQNYCTVSTELAGGGKTRLQFLLHTGTGAKQLVAGQGDVPIGQWTLVVATYDGQNMRIYQDAILVGSCGKTGNITQNDSVETWIGGSPSGATHRPWNGRIDEVAVFDYALAESQVQELFDARHAVPGRGILSWN